MEETDYVCQLCGAPVVISLGVYECDCLVMSEEYAEAEFPNQWVEKEYG